MSDPRSQHSGDYDPAMPPTGAAPHGGYEAHQFPSTPPPVGPGGLFDDAEYVVESGPTSPDMYRHAPDPFAAPAPAATAQPADGGRSSKKGWIIPLAALLALAIIAAAVYFLFLKKDDSADKASDSSSSATASGHSSDSGGSSGSGSSDAGGSQQDAASIAGAYDVNGTIESYSGPQTGQLGGAAKKAGDPAFKSAQTWTLAGDCTEGKACELTITPGDAKVTLALEGETWKGQTKEQIQCSAGGPPSEATVAIEIPKAGGSAKRTTTATCAQPITEVDQLTLTKK